MALGEAADGTRGAREPEENSMSTMTEISVTTQVHRVYVKASAATVWDAITDPDRTEQYGYGGRVEYDLRPGGSYRAAPSAAMAAYGAPDVILEGEVLEADAPRRLVQTWHPLFDPEIAAEAVGTVTWELDEGENGVTKLTLTHELEGAPRTAALVGGEVPEAGGGWSFVLSDLKTLLETDTSLEAC